MKNELLEKASMLIAPIIDKIKKEYEEELLAEQRKPGVISKSKEKIQNQVNEEGEKLKKILLNPDEIKRFELGFNILVQEANRLSNETHILNDIEKAGKYFDSPGKLRNEYETLQDLLGLSKETFDAGYEIAVQLFNEKRIDDALNLFIFLTSLNYLIFEPWLARGLCWQYQKNYPEALRAYSVASLVNLEQPEPHLFSVDCYLAINRKDLAKNALNFALTQISEEDQLAHNDMITKLKDRIKKS